MTIRGLVRSMAAPALVRIDNRIDARLAEALSRLPASAPPVVPGDSTRRKVYVPPIRDMKSDPDAPFMQFATCSASDFMHPELARICESLNVRLRFHRKLWEYAFIVHHLERAGMLAVGSRGVVFGVGAEPLPAAFAARGCEIVATDAPTDIADLGGWREYRHSEAVDALTHEGICDLETLRERVSHRFVDMNDIPADLDGFDFAWSACCFEHLGSLQHGADFVVNSVERCLRPGGIAVHTTEYNLSSNDETLEVPNLSIYRRRDIEALIDRLRQRGHKVSELTIAPDSSYLDQYVDVRPYSGELHLKLELAGYATTSVGLVIERGTGKPNS